MESPSSSKKLNQSDYHNSSIQTINITSQRKKNLKFKSENSSICMSKYILKLQKKNLIYAKEEKWFFSNNLFFFHFNFPLFFWFSYPLVSVIKCNNILKYGWNTVNCFLSSFTLIFSYEFPLLRFIFSSENITLFITNLFSP